MRINVPPYLKAWMAAFGTSVMSLMVVFDSISSAIEDEVVTFDEIGIIIPIIIAQAGTIFSVFQAENKTESK